MSKAPDCPSGAPRSSQQQRLDRPAGAPTSSYLRERHAVIQAFMPLLKRKAPLVRILEGQLPPLPPSSAAPVYRLARLYSTGSAASAFVSDKDALHSSAYQKILFPRHCHPLRVTSAFISCGVALLSFMAAAPLNFLPPLQIFEAPLSITLGCSCPPCPPASAATGRDCPVFGRWCWLS